MNNRSKKNKIIFKSRGVSKSIKPFYLGNNRNRDFDDEISFRIRKQKYFKFPLDKFIYSLRKYPPRNFNAFRYFVEILYPNKIPKIEKYKKPTRKDIKQFITNENKNIISQYLDCNIPSTILKNFLGLNNNLVNNIKYKKTLNNCSLQNHVNIIMTTIN